MRKTMKLQRESRASLARNFQRMSHVEDLSHVTRLESELADVEVEIHDTESSASNAARNMFTASAPNPSKEYMANPTNKSIDLPHSPCPVSETRSLKGALASLQLTQYEPMFHKEAVDLHALALLSPGELRGTFGMPLGLAAKLIERGQIAYSKSRAFHKNSVLPDTTIQEGTSASEVDETSALLASGDGVAPRSLRSICCSTLWEAWRSSKTLCSYIQNVLYPLDHRICYVRQCIVTKSNDELQTYLTQVSDGWIFISSLLLASSMTLWSMNPPYATPVQRLVFDGIMSLSTFLIFLSIVVWMVFNVSLQSVSAANVKAFVIGALGIYGVLHTWLVASTVFLLVGIFYYTYLTMDRFATSTELAGTWWPMMSMGVVFPVESVITCLAFKFAMVMGRLVHNGCLMSARGVASVDFEKVSSPVFPNFSQLEARISHDVWAQVRKLPDNVSPLEYLF